MELRRWRLHVLVLTTGVFGSVEAGSTPASLGWRVAAQRTPQNYDWDVGLLIFNTAAGPLQIGGPEGCEPIDSGSFSDAAFGGVAGYGSAQIFDKDVAFSGGLWGGRSSGSLFFVGLLCETPVVVHSVQIDQGNQLGANWFAQIKVQAILASTGWTTLFEAQVPYESSLETVFNDMNQSETDGICSEACQKDGYCCNDPWVGSNQLISCSQACLMKASGLAVSSCYQLCARNGSSGCDLSVEGKSYNFCSLCADLTYSSKCTNGVASTQACDAGCALSPPTEALAAQPTVTTTSTTTTTSSTTTTATTTRTRTRTRTTTTTTTSTPTVAAAAGHKSDVDHALIVAVPVGVLACIASIGLIVACRYIRRKSSDPHARSRDAEDSNGLPRLLRAALPGQLFKSPELRRDLDPCWAAISVAQLGELRQLAMTALGTEYWTATMHDINRVVLQPLCQRHGICYAHIVNFEELLHITVFVSHAWLENLEQFFQSINSAFQDWTMKPNLWICATALLQSTDPATVSLQVGAGREAPHRAQRHRGPLRANLVLLGVFLAYQQGMIHRPGAVMVVGPSMFGTGTKEVDVTSARSSNLEDKRKILEHISHTASYQVIK
ncbi:unnamed protein product [Polarella glacialis]|uniref:Uncharacterized protein n=1 Tax=Polarella glacialis TaxID=89957 RepID=A0A813HIW2_POLGL|nr:unnamed protein product [Polarella glacialis]